MSSDKHCCVPGCKESGGSHQVLHLFPNPDTDKERFNTWLHAVGGDILGLENERIYKYRRVCHNHFDMKYLRHNNRISKIALPTLNIPGPLVPQKYTFGANKPMVQTRNIRLPSSIEDLEFQSGSGPSITASLDMDSNLIKKENIEPVVLVQQPKELTETSEQVLPLIKLTEQGPQINFEPVVLVQQPKALTKTSEQVLLLTELTEKSTQRNFVFRPGSGPSTASLGIIPTSDDKENIEPQLLPAVQGLQSSSSLELNEQVQPNPEPQLLPAVQGSQSSSSLELKEQVQKNPVRETVRKKVRRIPMNDKEKALHAK